jgi:hypothetical protein
MKLWQLDDCHWYDMTRPRTCTYSDPGQREPILVVDHTNHELTGFGIAVLGLVVVSLGAITGEILLRILKRKPPVTPQED